MKLLTSYGEPNFAEILPHVIAAKSVFVATFNLDYSDRNPLLAALKKMPAGARATVVTNVPNRKLSVPAKGTVNADPEVERYITLLNPENFQCSLEPWFCFDNHAKIIVCDDVAYVGSANFTAGSRRNFEVGYLVDHPADLAELREFADEIVAGAIPYHNVQGYHEQQILLKFAAAIPALAETIEDVCCEWEELDYSGLGKNKVKPDLLQIPDDVAAEICNAYEAAIRLLRRARECRVEPEIDALVKRTAKDLVRLQKIVANIEEGRVMPQKLNESKAQYDLVMKHLNTLSSNGSVDEVQAHPVFQDELDEVLSENVRHRTECAEKCYNELTDLLTRAANGISAMLNEIKVNEKLRQLEKKYKG